MNDAALIVSSFGTLTGYAATLATRLQEPGLLLLTAFGATFLAWQISIQVLQGDDLRAVLAKTLLPTAIKIGLVAWAIKDIQWLGKELLDGFDLIAATVVGSEVGASILTTALAAQLEIANALWESMGASGNKAPSTLELIVQTVAGGAAFWVKLGTLAVSLGTAALSGAMYFVSQILASIALALAPVLLPFLVIEQLSFVATGWLRFFFSAGLMKVLGPTMLSFTAAMATDMANLSKAFGDQENAAALNLSLALMMLLLQIVMLILSFQIPAIANGLVNGQVIGNMRATQAGGWARSAMSGSKPPPGGGGGSGGNGGGGRSTRGVGGGRPVA